HQGRAPERADPEDRGPPPCLARGHGPGAVAAEQRARSTTSAEDKALVVLAQVLERHGKRLEPAQGGGLAPFRRRRLQGEAGHPPKEGPEGDLSLHPREGRPEAEVDPEPSAITF